MPSVAGNHADHAKGHVVLRSLKQDNRYTVRKVFNCTWACDGQALYRISSAAEPALALEDDLTWQWCNDAQHNVMRHLALRCDRGYLSFSISGRNDRLVIGAPPLFPDLDSSNGRELFTAITPTLVEMGVQRMSRARIWEPLTKGYEKIAFTKNTDTKDVTRRLSHAGLRYGMIENPAPDEYLLSMIHQRLEEGELGFTSR